MFPSSWWPGRCFNGDNVNVSTNFAQGLRSVLGFRGAYDVVSDKAGEISREIQEDAPRF